jgi:signal transduction histidine kinase
VRSLRGRILAHLGLAVLVSTLLTVAVAAVLVRGNVRNQALSGLERQADVAAALGAGGEPTTRRVLFARGGRARPAGPRVAGAILDRVPAGDRSGRLDVGGRELMYAARGDVVLVRRAKLAAADWRPFLSSLLIAGLGGAAVAAALSALLARRLTRPLGELGAAAQRLAAGAPDARVPVRGRDELAAVGTAFNEMASGLAAARAAEREFLMSVSHELKTPLTAIGGYAEALGDGAVPPDEAGAVIGAEARRLERLVRDLLDLARLDRRAFAVARAPVDLGEVARRAAERAEPRTRERGVAVGVSAGAGAWGIGDEGRLLQAVSNLLDNALRVTPAGGRVTIEARPGALTVADTGPGLRPEDLPRAFDRFHLHARYGAGSRDGSGLGLAIVHELAAAMGGRAEVESRLGAGARFTIRLSAAAPPRRAPLQVGFGDG